MPELDITGLTTHGQADVVGRGDRFVAALGEAILGSDEPKLARREIADAVAVHGQLDGLGRGRDPPAFGFELCKRIGVDRFDLGNDHVGPVLLDRGPERGAVEHRKHLGCIGELHCRGIDIAIAGDHPAAEALGSNRELAAELARAEKHESGSEHERAIAASIILR